MRVIRESGRAMDILFPPKNYIKENQYHYRVKRHRNTWMTLISLNYAICMSRSRLERPSPYVCYSLESACQHRNVPDCEFFLNKQDYPHLKVYPV